ncbi:MAG TPA: hypothetical protein VMV58_02215 [Desulfosporosinus sp.]|nr:hypothetical protein [Desulfosporosinus sp.]
MEMVEYSFLVTTVLGDGTSMCAVFMQELGTVLDLHYALPSIWGRSLTQKFAGETER